MRRHLLAVVAVVWAAAGCTKLNPNYCADAGKENGYACSKLDAGSDARTNDARDVADARDGGDGELDAIEAPAERPTCTNASCGVDGGQPICDIDAGMCRACMTDNECVSKGTSTPACEDGQCWACTADTHCTAATKPICDTHVCRGCTPNSTDCATRGGGTPACASSGSCVQCVGNGDCSGTKPICNMSANTCRPCASDAECPVDPGVCMTDGHCATTGEVIFVDSAASCAVADGTFAKPYCAPNDGVSHLALGRNVIVLQGNASSQMALATTGLSPVIIGRKNASNADGSVPAIAAAGITITSDTVLVRDLTVNAGTGTSSKGIVVMGASAKLTLLRVTVSLGMGLGVDAESGASLTMDECYVFSNSAGGILINGSGYSIQNTAIANNGYGIQFSTPVQTGSLFRFNTVVGNSVSATCDLMNTESLAESIVTAPMINCSLVDSLTTAPTFSTTRPFHLTAHQACPTAPAVGTFPDHDIDGDARTGTIDCGADQFQ